MSPPLRDSVKDRIQVHLANKLSIKTISKAEGVSERVVKKIKANIVTWDHHTAPAELHGKSGRRPLLDFAARESLRQFLLAKPWAHLKEMASFLLDKWGIVIGLPSISKTLKQMNINHKSLRRAARKRSQLCRDGYILEPSEYNYTQLVCLDESGANQQSGSGDFPQGGPRPSASCALTISLDTNRRLTVDP